MSDLRTRLLDLATRIATEFKTIRTEKQNTLVSATNIKTVNSQSLLGAGNITIAGSGGDIKADGTVPFAANQSMGGYNINNLGFAVLGGDAVSYNHARTNIFFSVDTLAPNGTNISTVGNGSSIGGVTLLTGDFFFCLSTSASVVGVFLVGASSSTFWGQVKAVGIAKGTSKGRIFIADLIGGYTESTSRPNHTGTQLAVTISDFNTAALAAVSTGAPALLDTLDELAAALGDDPNFATTMTTALGNRVRYDAAQSLTAPQKTQACTNIGIGEPDTDFVATFNTGLL